MSATSASLLTLGKALNKAGFSAKLAESPATVQLDGMVLTLGSERRGSATPLHLQVWDPHNHPGVSEKMLVQFVATLPFRFDKACIADIVRFVLLLNSISDFPGFGVEPAERVITHRYTMISLGEHIDLAAIIASIQMIDTMIARYGEILEHVSTGKCNLAEAFTRLRAMHQVQSTESSQSTTKQRVPTFHTAAEKEAQSIR